MATVGEISSRGRLPLAKISYFLWVSGSLDPRGGSHIRTTILTEPHVPIFCLGVRLTTTIIIFYHNFLAVLSRPCAALRTMRCIRRLIYVNQLLFNWLNAADFLIPFFRSPVSVILCPAWNKRRAH